MSKLDLKWRILMTIILVGLAVYGMYPPLDPDGPEGEKEGKLNLGLDLQGGMHMVMDVKTEEAVEAELVLVKKQFEQHLRREKIRGAEITVNAVEHTLFFDFADAVERDEIARMLDDYPYDVTKDMAGSMFRVTAVMRAENVRHVKERSLQQAILTIRNRIDELGVREPIVQQQKSLTKGAMDRILIQLPGVKDIQKAKEIIGKTALLEFRLVLDGPGDRMELLESNGGKLPRTGEFYEDMKSRAGKQLVWILERDAEVTGADLDSVRVDRDEYGAYAVGFTLNSAGSKKFARLTQNNIDRQLAIVLDGRVQSAPVIQSRISKSGQISGDFSFEDAEKLMIVLKSGALPASVVPFEERTVGPSLGNDSIQRGIRSILFGGILVILFMIIWYRVSGVIADIGVFCTLVFLVAMLAGLEATLTLPGIAGIILTVGMAVDANVLIFERIREELRQGKTIRTAVATGYERAFITIMDANVTTLIASLVLLQFGIGPIRGFAVTLAIGIVASMVSALFIARVLMDLILVNPKVNKLSI
ncbi:protein translocase subunit SecD [bacterium]|nr:protein translocase subunit SecD [candidate division CSSED10-310 bacterium]